MILPLQMFGKNGDSWHIKGEPIRRRKVVGYTVYKTGKKKGQKKPIKEWVMGKQMSKGFYPSANHIYVNASFRGGGQKMLSPIAEDKLLEWKAIAMEWQKQTGFKTVDAPHKVIIELMYYLPDLKKRDTHNAKKLLLDSLEGVIHNDDMFIIDRTLDFGIDPDNPRIEVSVKFDPNLIEIPLPKGAKKNASKSDN